MAQKKAAKPKALVKKIAKPVAKAASKSPVKAKPKSVDKATAKSAAKTVKKSAVASKTKPAMKKPAAKASVKTSKPAVKKPVVKSSAKATKPAVKPVVKSNSTVAKVPPAKVSPPTPSKKVAAPPVVTASGKPSSGKTSKVNAVPEKPVATLKQSDTKPKSEPSKISPTMNSAPNTKSSNATVNKTDSGKTEKKSQSKKPPATYDSETKGFTPYDIKKGEEYMNEQQKDHFKKILLNWRSELMQEVDRTVHHMQDEAANPPDPADRATLEEEFSIELRTRDRERRLIKKIDSTIELIANDDYGYCDSCGVEIGIRRLEARPTANKCIDCKTLDEIKEKQLGAP